eukprot:scaffold5017_cov171-Amphora_coffeaeformis.AAC.19
MRPYVLVPYSSVYLPKIGGQLGATKGSGIQTFSTRHESIKLVTNSPPASVPRGIFAMNVEAKSGTVTIIIVVFDSPIRHIRRKRVKRIGCHYPIRRSDDTRKCCFLFYGNDSYRLARHFA